MPLVQGGNADRFREAVSQEITSRLGDEAPDGFRTFVDAFFHNFPLDEINGREVRDVYACTYLLWQTFTEHCHREPTTLIFNPELESHGFASPDTVVTIVTEDRPFLVDSLRLTLDRRDVAIHLLHSAVVEVERDDAGALQSLRRIGEGAPSTRESDQRREAVIYFEIHRRSSDDELAGLRADLAGVMADVELAVGDFDAMRTRAGDLLESLEKSQPDCIPQDEVDEARAFLRWMLDDHFTFLGVTEVVSDLRDGARAVREDTDRRLGLLKKHDRSRPVELLHEMNPRAASLWLEPSLLGFAKSSVRSTVHRNVYSDYLTLKQFDESGQVSREIRFLGLFTSRVYNQSPFRIPVVRKKLESVLRDRGVASGSHQGRHLEHILESYPRDELFQISVPTLGRIAQGITNLQERRQVRLFVRRDDYGRFFSCLVYVPRDLYHTELRRRVETILSEAFDSDEVEFTTHFSDSVLARTHFVLRVDPMREIDFDAAEIEARIVEATRTWDQHLEDALINGFGAEQGVALARLYAGAFSASYKEDIEPRVAVHDIATIEGLDEEGAIGLTFFREVEDSDNRLRFKLFQRDAVIALSDVLPILENLGVRVIGEHPYPVRIQDGRRIFVHEFELEYEFADRVDLALVKTRFPDAFRSVWNRQTDSDGFNRLILGTRLCWREAMLLRSYARYMKQTAFPFSQQYIAETLSRHLDMAERLVALFHARFSPEATEDREQACAEIEAGIMRALDAVESLDEDRIIRRYVSLIQNTLRTNYYQRDQAGGLPEALALKLAAREIPDLPKPLPCFELFVYSARVEGVHLRWGRVARGGIRWSDRQEDYRTEVLGLVKAQQVKNSVIVPVGAKGGFVAKRAVNLESRDDIQREGIACYRVFIRSLLDVTDNYIDGEIARPRDCVAHDEDDPYLVVAADKGTATFSDIANEISIEAGHWLGDGFASGGSIGYDHKKMGITARGAWVSVQRHFEELGIDVQQEPIRVVAVGDMSGDVFGNGMLLSRKIKLVAAFNHAHVFLDPDPCTERSYAERKRLFELARSSWSDYDPEAISEGGGVFSRSAKSIPLSEQVRTSLGIDAEELDPNALITALLSSPVDLVFNGGIGTYVKASSETHAEVGDKANDCVRIDAKQLRCRVLAEGGNLGITQRGRVEYCLEGGRANTDFIDNAAGVNCSDHEVNIKIALGELVARGDLTEKQRRRLLEDNTDAVAELVLRDSDRQVQAIRIADHQGLARMGEYRRYITTLVDAGQLDREIEFIPDDDALAERKAADKGLTRPEISLLVSYTKVILKEALCCDEIAQNPTLVDTMQSAFPPALVERFGEELAGHRLQREIVATQLANEIVNRMGFTFVSRLLESTGSTMPEIANAYAITRDIFDLEARFRQIESLSGRVESALQVSLMTALMGLARRGCRWLLRNRRGDFVAGNELDRFRPGSDEVERALPKALSGAPLHAWRKRKQQLREGGVPEELAAFVASAPHLHNAFAMIEAADRAGVGVDVALDVDFRVAERLDLQWLRGKIDALRIDNHWQARSRENCLDDLDWQERALTESILTTLSPDANAAGAIESWLELHDVPAKRWTQMLTDLHSAEPLDLPMCTVALRELLDWSQTASHTPKPS
ncbi:MAG: NAD-glutamate dehydrogenase [Myxococcota bacterium]|jgi:glutamate dehydrogenase|nr:NAD-glutamate dehydrogenase [Myxococcota bacterium]